MNQIRLTVKVEKLAALFLLIALLSGLIIGTLAVYIEAIMFLFFAIIRLTNISKQELIILLPLILILITGILLSKGENFIIIKDIWYFTKPIIYIMFGYVLARWNLKEKSFLGIILLIAICSSVIRIIQYIFCTDNAVGINEIRAIVGAGSFLEAYILAFILSKRRYKYIRNYLALPYWLNILIISASIFLSFSRTGYLVFLISILAFNNYFLFNLQSITKNIFKLSIIVGIILSSILITNKYFEKDTLVYNLTNKFLNIFSEISAEKKFTSKQIINDNWRGYETLLVKNEIKKGSNLQKIFGFGFGKTIFIGYEGWLGPTNINIPLFHNGFIQIRLKTGYFGLILYFVFFLYLFIKINKEKSYPANFLKAVLVSSFLSTLVITGLYNKTDLDTSCIIIGYFFSMIYLRNNMKEIIDDSASFQNINSLR